MGCSHSTERTSEGTQPNKPVPTERSKPLDLARPPESRAGQGSSTESTRRDELRGWENIMAQASTMTAEQDRAKLAGSSESAGKGKAKEEQTLIGGEQSSPLEHTSNDQRIEVQGAQSVVPKGSLRPPDRVHHQGGVQVEDSPRVPQQHIEPLQESLPQTTFVIDSGMIESPTKEEAKVVLTKEESMAKGKQLYNDMKTGKMLSDYIDTTEEFDKNYENVKYNRISDTKWEITTTEVGGGK